MAIQPIGSNIPQTPLVNPGSNESRKVSAPESGKGGVKTEEATANKTSDTEKTSATNSAKQPSTEQMLKDAAKKANDAISELKSNIQFSVDKNTGVNVVKIIDTETNKTIRQIPSEEMLSIASRLEEIKGLLIQNKA